MIQSCPGKIEEANDRHKILYTKVVKGLIKKRNDWSFKRKILFLAINQ